MLLVDCHKKFLSYLRLEKDYSKETVKSYRIDFNHFLKFLDKENAEPELEKVTTPMIRDFITYMAHDLGFHPNTIRRRIHSLKSFFKFCMTQEYIEKNPTLAVSVPKKRQALPIYISQDDLMQLIQAPLEYGGQRTRIRDWLMLRTLALTGLRRQELLNLQWRDVCLRDSNILVRNGKGDKDRLIPIPSALVDDLRMYKDMRVTTDYAPVFPSVSGKRLGPRPLSSMFTKYVHLAGLDGKHYSPHKIRHSFATFLLQKNVSLIEIQELLGHADITSTRIYLHTNSNRLKDAVMSNPILELNMESGFTAAF
ncbi:tyrosine-type recombinase/integrase [Alicyclobacillus sp. SO9]|uniref:tyrosine-type recombinase/integrase n=1 Tax=Alicyclobacillus sp. SO9 TaxID=2665646 RepID=UPI0018E8DB34|nr:tyrosine-type recombinase/integrase [Alicyclobacillus sp. SO9]QQE77267.1 tyrosine-type recombinase/integrase [Alicyclobacillus sp. SO9]